METGFHTLTLYYHNSFNFTIYFVFCEYLFYLWERNGTKGFETFSSHRNICMRTV